MLSQGPATKVHLRPFALNCSAEEEEGLEEGTKAHHGVERLHSSLSLHHCAVPSDSQNLTGDPSRHRPVLGPQGSPWQLGLHLLSLPCHFFASLPHSSQSQPTPHPSRTSTEAGTPRHCSGAVRAAGDGQCTTCGQMHQQKRLGSGFVSTPAVTPGSSSTRGAATIGKGFLCQPTGRAGHSCRRRWERMQPFPGEGRPCLVQRSPPRQELGQAKG